MNFHPVTITKYLICSSNVVEDVSEILELLFFYNTVGNMCMLNPNSNHLFIDQIQLAFGLGWQVTVKLVGLAGSGLSSVSST